ncbi:hypothetical protein Cpir12675_003865 [Ceratocystis pirilliformis]|uniref:Uncharacterized protein n=1 Tax=Ceratocystis pirilliformis TaxID=259994 RepID=A0ABR3Z0B1_9PEZI
MPLFEDPRIRQFWNQISHNAEVVTENTIASIWTFQHVYINPCLGSVSEHVDQCTSICLGDREERARRQRERERARAEYSFDFYDDWARDEGGLGSSSGGGVGASVTGLLSNWSNDDWDRLLAGSGSGHKSTDGITDQPPTKRRGMSYGTRRWGSKCDTTVIPSTQSIGILGKLPWKIGGTLRYKPSAADLQDRPSRYSQGERQALLGHSDSEEYFQGIEQPIRTRARRNTTGSGATSGSYRSRGDLFPSDGEGDEDAVPLDDEFTVDFDRSDDRSSNRTRSSKGKYPTGTGGGRISRTVSRSTEASEYSAISSRRRLDLVPKSPTAESYSGMQSIEDLRMEEENIQRQEELEIEANRRAAMKVALDLGLNGQSQKLINDYSTGHTGQRRPRPEVLEDGVYIAPTPAKKAAVTLIHNQHPSHVEAQVENTEVLSDKAQATYGQQLPGLVPDNAPTYSYDYHGNAPKEACADFVPARLPRFT